MKHIRQKVSTPYTVVLANGYIGELENHPSIVAHPEFFEIVDCEIPEEIQYLIFQME